MILFGAEDNKSGAIFSECKRYRYKLWRIWDPTKPFIMFVGLNPSTADQDKDDPTIRKVKAFAKAWGYGGVYMLNLFAIISTDPKILISPELTREERIGPQNDEYLKVTAWAAEKIIFAWGAFNVDGREVEVMDLIPSAFALVINSDGSPRHPLYVKGDTVPVLYHKKADEKSVF